MIFLCESAARTTAAAKEYQYDKLDSGKKKTLSLFLVMALGIVLVRCGIVRSQDSKVLKLDGVEETSLIYSNAGNLIIPIVTAILGKEWVIYTSAFLSVQLFLLWSHAKMKLCGEKGST